MMDALLADPVVMLGLGASAALFLLITLLMSVTCCLTKPNVKPAIRAAWMIGFIVCLPLVIVYSFLLDPRKSAKIIAALALVLSVVFYMSYLGHTDTLSLAAQENLRSGRDVLYKLHQSGKVTSKVYVSLDNQAEQLSDELTQSGLLDYPVIVNTHKLSAQFTQLLADSKVDSGELTQWEMAFTRRSEFAPEELLAF